MHSIVPRPLNLACVRTVILAACASGMLVACNQTLDGAGSTVSGGNGGNGSISGNGTASSGGGGTQSSYTISGTVMGLAGADATLANAGLVVQTNGAHPVPILANGVYTFATLPSGATYAVTVLTQPTSPAQVCHVTNGTGTVTTANITAVTINCLNTGRFLFVTNPFDNSGNGSVAAFAIDPTSGALTPAAGSPYSPTENQPFNLAIDPNGKYLYVTDSQSALISTDTIGTGGALTLDVSTASTGAAGNHPFGLAIDPAGPYVYAGSDIVAANGTLEAYTANAGALTPVTGPGGLATSTYPSSNTPRQVVVDPVNALLFAASPYDGTIVVYSIGAGGQLTAVPGSPFTFQAGYPTNQPYGLAVYPKGGTLYVTDSVGNSVDQYSYAANGTLGRWITYEVGAAPNGVTIDPTGSFLYVSNSGDGTVSAFTINASTGELAAIAGSPFVASGTASPNTPTAVQVDPSGQFAYVANGDAGNLTVFTINLASGALTPALGGPVSTILIDGGPSAIAIE
jgi:6-phosphogluconolactonase (cycloisomerase 2 family)